MISRFRRASDRSLGADELFLILLLIFLTIAAGKAPVQTVSVTSLHPTQRLANAPESSFQTLHIVFDGDVKVRFEGQPAMSVPGEPCSPAFDQSIGGVIRAQMKDIHGPIETVISAAPETRICVYLDTQDALEGLYGDNLIEKRVRFARTYAPEARN